MVAEPAAKVTRIEEGRATYRTTQGVDRPTFTGIPDWLYSYKPRLAKGRGWEMLDTILHHQRMGQRHQPVAISLTQFAEETGHSIPTVRKALSDLARVGLLYEEQDEPERRDSGFRYAIQDQPGQGVIRQDGCLIVSLLDGWHEVEPARLVERVEGMKEIYTPDNEVCKKLSHRSKRNFHTGLKETFTPPLDQPRQEAETQFAIIESIESIDNGAADAAIPPAPSDSQAQGDGSAAWLSETSATEQKDLFGQPVAPTSPSQPTHSKPRKPTLADEPLVLAWLAGVNRKSKPNQIELDSWAKAITALKTADPPVTPEEMTVLVARYRALRDKDNKPYRCRHPRVIASNLDGLREEPAKASTSRPPARGIPAGDGRDLGVLLKYATFDERPSGQAMIPSDV